MRILLLEDDLKLASFIERGLSEEGYTLVTRHDGNSGYQEALSGKFDLLILDLMLPGLDGLSICGNLRSQGFTTPILMLTVMNSSEDKVRGLQAGADDYLGKPFSFDELLARIQSLLRRSTEYNKRKLKYSDLELDLISRNAMRCGQTIELSGKEFSLLEYMMSNAGRAIPEEELIEKVWGMSFDPQTNIVTVYMHHLRSKIDNGMEPKLIHTVRGKGYMLGESK